MGLVDLISVSKSYDIQAAVRDVSFSLDAGERLVLFGPSGCGKTTVLRLIAGFIAPDSGRIAIDGTDVASNGRILREPEDRGVGMVFQDLALWPHLTVRGNLEFGLKAHAIPPSEREARVRDLLEKTELTEAIDRRPGELSGGQQQRVAIARALVLRPRVLLMDEPFANLDEDLHAKLRRELVALQQQFGFGLLFVTHDREDAAELATRTAFMSHGALQKIV